MQQTIVNVEQIRDVEERIQSLSEILTSPVGDQDTGEKARRAALKMFVFPPLELYEHISELVGFMQDIVWDPY